MKNLWKRFALSLMAVAMIVAIVPAVTPDAQALSYNTDIWTSEDKTSNGTKHTAGQTFILSADDMYRAQNGELSISASSTHVSNGSRNREFVLQVKFYDSKGNTLSTQYVDDSGYSVSKQTKTLTLTADVPADTYSIYAYAKSEIGTSGTLQLTGVSLILLDSVTPSVSSVYSRTANDTYPAGTVVDFTMQLSEPVTVSGSPTLTMSTGGTATYSSQSSDNAILYFSYTIPSTGTTTNSAEVYPTAVNSFSVSDGAGNSLTSVSSNLDNASIYMDNQPPSMSSFTTSASSGTYYGVDESITFAITFDENIVVSGTPYITLNNGQTATYYQATTSDTSIANFKYTVGSGDTSVAALDISSVSLSGITDKVGNTVSYTTSMLNDKLDSYTIVIDTSAPTVTFDEVADGTYFTADDVISVTPEDAFTSVKLVYSAWTTSASAAPSFGTNANVSSPDYIITKPTTSGVAYLNIKATDDAGNTAIVQSPYTYIFDYDNPVITDNSTYTGDGSILKDAIFTVTDAHSGISETTYKWINADNATVLSGYVESGVAIDQPTTDGIYSLQITAIDNADNTATATFTGYDIDGVAPTCEFSDNFNATSAKTHSTTVTLADEKTGVGSFSYIWSESATQPDVDDSSWIATTNTTITSSSDLSGYHFLHVKVSDTVGNTAIYTSAGTFAIDNTAPTVVLTPDGNAGNVGRGEYLIGITISDAMTMYSDIVKQYVISSATTCPTDLLQTLTEETVTVPSASTDTYLYVQATDSAGNVNTFKSQVFTTDTQAPSGSLEKYSDIYYTAVNTVTVALDAKDDHAQSIYMQLDVDGTLGDWIDYQSTYVITFGTEEKEHSIKVRFKDECDNISSWSDAVTYYYDVTPPILEVKYSTTELTNGDVTVTATAYDSGYVSDVTFITAQSAVFTANGSTTFTVQDEAGNATSATALVENIDKTNPVIAISTDDVYGKQHQSISAKITATDASGIDTVEYRFNEVGGSNGSYATISSGTTVELDDVDGTYTLEVRATDIVGNQTTSTSGSFYLDNTDPEGGVVYTPSADSRTASNVLATLSTNEETTITNNGGSNVYTFTDNGSFTFTFEDEAGNESSTTATVAHIDRTVPSSSIFVYDENGSTLDLTDWYSGNLTYLLRPPTSSYILDVKFNGVDVEDSNYVTIITEDAMTYYEISTYGTLTFTTKDTETAVEGEEEIEVRVDKSAPEITSINYTTQDPTNQDVAVTIVATDDLNTVTYTKGNSYIFEENGSYTFVVTDEAGNTTSQKVTVSNIDKEVPNAVLTYKTADGATYDPDDYTNQTVTAYISFNNEEYDVTITNNNGSTTKEFESDGTFTFEYIDVAGNVGSTLVEISRIDKVAPTGYVTLSHSGWTNEDVVATIYATDDRGDVYYENTTTGTYTFTENGTFTFQVTDKAGNLLEVNASYDRIDKDAPVLSYTLTPSEDNPTSYSVFATLVYDEPVSILNTSQSETYQFTSNGSYKYMVEDRAGNYGEVTIEVNHISRESTITYVTYSSTELTNQSVYATVLPVDITQTIFAQNNGGNTTYVFDENGEFTFEYTNSASIDGSITASVVNIDKIAPEVSYALSTLDLTNEDVYVTLSTDDTTVSFPYNVIDGVYTFTSNEKVLIPATDSAGNVTYVLVEVTNIDKEAPVITLESYYACVALGETFDATAGLSASDNTALAGDVVVTSDVDVNTVGDYTVTYYAIDTAGNSTEVEKSVTVYDPTAFNVIINDKMPSGGQIITDDKTADIEVLNGAGDVTIKYLNNKVGIGAFKDDGTTITSGHTFTEVGYYTLLISDSERQSLLVYLFVE